MDTLQGETLEAGGFSRLVKCGVFIVAYYLAVRWVDELSNPVSEAVIELLLYVPGMALGVGYFVKRPVKLCSEQARPSASCPDK